VKLPLLRLLFFVTAPCFHLARMFRTLQNWFGLASHNGENEATLDHCTRYAAVDARIHFLDRLPVGQASKLYSSQVPFTKVKQPQTNIKSHEETLKVFDIRGHETSFSLDSHGFELVKHEISFDDWFDGPRVVKEVYPMVEELIRAQLGSGVRTVIHDHTVRAPLILLSLLLICTQLRKGLPTNGDATMVTAQKKSNLAVPSRVAHVGKAFVSSRPGAKSLTSDRSNIRGDSWPDQTILR
jgi:hypothetical protein